MQYNHNDWQSQSIQLPVGKVVCVGRNYLDHINELNNAVPDSALLFMKPASSLCDVNQPIEIPTEWGECHNELEVAVLIKDTVSKQSPEQVRDAIWGYGLGLDLTLRELQSSLKNQGLPWEKAKAFDASCPVSGFVPAVLIPEPEYLKFELKVDGETRQLGHAELMMRNVFELISEISQHFTLLPGDIVMTGTPKGVAALHKGQQLALNLGTFLDIQTSVKM